ncbi:MAG TPA: hypothetical protein VL175_16210 [Pirellulales bacterium]|jgi:hypothetical protein|nr:hypothetical protein [Pirellulales bacterium]
MDFHERLERAIQRGQRAQDAQARAQAEAAIGEEELKRLHSQYRLELSEHVEQCLRQLPQHFPGFRYETIVGPSGWGAGISRDDLSVSGGRRENYFSRLEMVVRPFSASHVLELAAKGTIRNKEIFNRSQFHALAHVDIASFRELADRWALEYAELYAAKG